MQHIKYMLALSLEFTINCYYGIQTLWLQCEVDKCSANVCLYHLQYPTVQQLAHCIHILYYGSDQKLNMKMAWELGYWKSSKVCTSLVPSGQCSGK